MSGKEITLKSLKKLCEEEIIGHKQVTIIVIIASSIFHFRWEQTRPKYYNSQSVNNMFDKEEVFPPLYPFQTDECYLMPRHQTNLEKHP